MRAKISVIGAGNVGASLAQRLAEMDLGHVVLVDVPQVEDPTKGKALDLTQCGPVLGSDTRFTGGSDFALIRDSHLVIVTAGVARKPGMTREQLVGTNARIVADVAGKVKSFAPNCILICVTNPLDAMTYVAHRVTGFPRHRVLGMAGVLDVARMRAFLAEALGVSVENIRGVILGTHGETMVPIPRFVSVEGVPLSELMSKDDIAKIMERVKQGGAEIVKLLGTGSAYYAPGASAAEMAEAILRDKKKIVCASAYLEGEYGLRDVFLGVPVTIGARGLEKIWVLNLTPDERAELQKAAASVREMIETMARTGVLP